MLVMPPSSSSLLVVPSLSHVTTHFVHLDRIAVRLDRPNNILNMHTVHSVHQSQSVGTGSSASLSSPALQRFHRDSAH